MEERLIRTAMLIGNDNIEKLKNSTVLIFGLGGVGGNAAEAIARSGVGHMILVDNDTVSVSNINRQVIALNSTVGMPKTKVCERRLKDINPEIDIKLYNCFFLPGNNDIIKRGKIDYIVDAIDTVTGKIEIIMQAQEKNIPVISSMGTAYRLDPSCLEVTDIYKTSGCPLAKVMRKELRDRNVKKLKVVYSTEKAIKPVFTIDKEGERKRTPASSSFVPPAAGLLIASQVIRDLLEANNNG
ncbi:MAG: tRNA threonylcarbamoyladenosine dehydratase [Clostridia bacterium]|jgi:tRNA A37 threonylcarbamoyladenosine dehydratase|nr:tRNA threonylcarbamoyladenosine dehydratase [Clostridia bacterium]